MSQPLLLCDNLFSVAQYPYLGWDGTSGAGLIDQTGGAGAAGYEAFRVADGRRSLNDLWLGPTNVDGFVVAACYGLPAGSTTPALLPRTANCLVLDRGHNLGGFPVALYASQDNFGTSQTVVSATVPLVGGTRPSDANGVLTEEGAWIITFPPVTAAYWKFDIPAMGSALAAMVVGLWVGLSYSPSALYRPFSEHPTTLRANEVMSPVGWRGRGTRAFLRSGPLEMKADTEFDYELARFHIEELYGSGRPMWVVQDQDRASEAWCAIRPLGDQGFVRPQNWYFPTGRFMAEEHEPLPVN